MIRCFQSLSLLVSTRYQMVLTWYLLFYSFNVEIYFDYGSNAVDKKIRFHWNLVYSNKQLGKHCDFIATIILAVSINLVKHWQSVVNTNSFVNFHKYILRHGIAENQGHSQKENYMIYHSPNILRSFQILFDIILDLQMSQNFVLPKCHGQAKKLWQK